MSKDLGTGDVSPLGKSKRPLSIIEENDNDEGFDAKNELTPENVVEALTSTSKDAVSGREDLKPLAPLDVGHWQENSVITGESKTSDVEGEQKDEKHGEEKDDDDNDDDASKLETIRSPRFNAIKQFFIDKTEENNRKNSTGSKPPIATGLGRVEIRNKSGETATARLNKSSITTTTTVSDSKQKSHTESVSRLPPAGKSTSITPKPTSGLRGDPTKNPGKLNNQSSVRQPATSQKSVSKTKTTTLSMPGILHGPNKPSSANRSSNNDKTGKITTAATSRQVKQQSKNNVSTTAAEKKVFPKRESSEKNAPRLSRIDSKNKEKLPAETLIVSPKAVSLTSGENLSSVPRSSHEDSNVNSKSSTSVNPVPYPSDQSSVSAHAVETGNEENHDAKPMEATPLKCLSSSSEDIEGNKEPINDDDFDLQIIENDLHYSSTELSQETPITQSHLVPDAVIASFAHVVEDEPDSHRQRDIIDSQRSLQADDGNLPENGKSHSISLLLSLPSRTKTLSADSGVEDSVSDIAQEEDDGISPRAHSPSDGGGGAGDAGAVTATESVSSQELPPVSPSSSSPSSLSSSLPPSPLPIVSTGTTASISPTVASSLSPATPPTAEPQSPTLSISSSTTQTIITPSSPNTPSPKATSPVVSSPPSSSPSSTSSPSLLQVNNSSAYSMKVVSNLNKYSPSLSRRYSQERNQAATINGKLPSFSFRASSPFQDDTLDSSLVEDVNNVNTKDSNGLSMEKPRLSPRIVVPSSPSLNVYRSGRRGSYYFRRKQSTDSLNSLSENEVLEGSEEQVSPLGLSVTDLNRLKETADRMQLSAKRPSILHWRQTFMDDTGLSRVTPVLDSGDGLEDNRLTHERKQKIDDALDWLRTELLEMRSQDQALARQLLTIRQDIHQLKLQRCTEEHQILLDDFKSELEELEEFSDVLDLPHPIYEDNPLKHIGITRHNMSARRFSAC